MGKKYLLTPFPLHFLCIYRSSRPEVFCKKGVLRNFAKITEKHLCQSLFFNKVAGLRLWYRCFPVNFAKFLRTPFLTEHLRWMLLYLVSLFSSLVNWLSPPQAKNLIRSVAILQPTTALFTWFFSKTHWMVEIFIRSVTPYACYCT